MSKSLSGLVLPAAGATAIVLALGVVMANRDYGRSEIETLQSRVGEVEAQTSQAAQMAEAEAARAAELETRIAEIQATAAAATGSGLIAQPAPVAKDRYGLGREAHADEIAAWDVDILPDGRGLPVGRGDVLTGEEVFADQCASCHGDFAEGVDNWPVLAGGFDTLADKDPVKTVGSYWPHLSTVWDYVHRSMPFGAAQTLSDDEVYAIVAYILYSNDLVDEDFELSDENFSEFSMYNAEGFIVDDRPDQEYVLWSAEPCMENCKDAVEITMRASVLDVTPEEETEEETTQLAVAETSTSNEDQVVAVAAVAVDPELAKKGEKVFRKCKACHAVGEGAQNKSGPQLNGILGRVMGSVGGFSYSSGFKDAASEGRVWDEAELAAFLAKPKSYMKGTKMSFAGLKKEADLAAITEYLKSFNDQ